MSVINVEKPQCSISALSPASLNPDSSLQRKTQTDLWQTGGAVNFVEGTRAVAETEKVELCFHLSSKLLSVT